MVQLLGGLIPCARCSCPCGLCVVYTHPPCSVCYIPCLVSFCSEAAMMSLFQDTGAGVGGGQTGGGLFQYQRLEWREQRDDGAAPARSRWRWLPAALNGKAASASPCLFSVRKLKWGALIPRKVAELSAKIRHAGSAAAPEAAGFCPTVIFMSPWGLPVISRPLLAGGHRSRYRHGRE